MKPNNSHHAKTNPGLSKKRFSHFFKQLGQTLELRVMLLLVHNEKIDCFSVYGLCKRYIIVFEAMRCYY